MGLIVLVLMSLPHYVWAGAQAGWPVADRIYSFLVFSFALKVPGLAIFLMRWPECYFPGKFDLFFHSHQIWHLSVLAATIYWILKLQSWLLEPDTCQL